MRSSFVVLKEDVEQISSIDLRDYSCAQVSHSHEKADLVFVSSYSLVYVHLKRSNGATIETLESAMDNVCKCS